MAGAPLFLFGLRGYDWPLDSSANSDLRRDIHEPQT